MEYSNFTYTARDKQQIFAQIWKCANAKSVVILVHGLGEHSGRYRHVAEFLNQNQFSVVAFDLPGHGKSGGKRGHIPSYETAMEIISHFVEEARTKFTGLPVFLYGHSMGGSLVLYYGLTRNPQITGVIASSPGLATAKPLPRATLAAGKILSRIYPSFSMNNNLDISGLSRDTSVVEAYKKDPLVHPWVSAALGIDIIEQGKWMLSKNHVITIPLLLLQGSADRLVNPTATRQFSEKVEGKVTFSNWEYLYHELHNEPEKREILQTIVGWMNNTMN
ncbi:MAG: alpha/beta hydrolase [Anaerolineae bacterium]|nr:alpha/beta hydrolase [Anaerolineae bacterium]